MGGWVGGGGGKGFVESKSLLSQRLNARPGREYGFSSLVKQNKKAEICFVIYIAGFFF